MNSAIQIEGLDFTYRKPGGSPWKRKKTVALTRVTTAVTTGTICGLVGHNGAGKTTLLLLVAGYKKPERGTVDVFTEPARSPRLLPRVGILTDRLSIHSDFRIHEVIRMFSTMHRIDRAEAEKPFALLGLTGLEDKEVKELSSGLRKRLYIAVSVMHNPELLLLDEPFAGLDPESVRTILDAILEWKRQGRTVVVSSHDLHELEEVIDELIVLREGTVLASGPFFELLSRDGFQAKVRIETTEELIEVDADPSQIAAAMNSLAERRATVVRVSTRGASLADLYARLHQSNEQGGSG